MSTNEIACSIYSMLQIDLNNSITLKNNEICIAMPNNKSLILQIKSV